MFAVLVSMTALAGPVGGPQIGQGVSLPKTYQSFVLVLQEGVQTIFNVSGSGQGDIDCIVSDQNGNLVGADGRSVDGCLIVVQPVWTGPFILRIINSGDRASAYVFLVN